LGLLLREPHNGEDLKVVGKMEGADEAEEEGEAENRWNIANE
jgi:hypothetical protein